MAAAWALGAAPASGTSIAVVRRGAVLGTGMAAVIADTQIIYSVLEVQIIYTVLRLGLGMTKVPAGGGTPILASGSGYVTEQPLLARS